MQNADKWCAYRGVIVNPFTPDFGRRPAILVGRDRLLARIAAALDAGVAVPGYTRMLLGQPGSGKTSLLAESRERSARSGMFVVESDATTPGLLERIPAAIADARERHAANPETRTRRISGVSIGPVGLSWSDIPQPRPAWSFKRHLESLSRWAQQQGSAVLLTVDEMHAGVRDEMRRLAADLQSITKINELPLAFVGAGRSDMAYTLLEDKKMTFFHRCVRENVPAVSVADAWRCLRHTTEAAGGSVAEDALKIMADSVEEGLPYQIQSVGYHAWQLSGAPRRAIDATAARMAVELASRDTDQKILTPMWHDLAQADQAYLNTLARLGDSAAPRDIAAASPARAARSLARSEHRLRAAGHVKRDQHGDVHLTGPLTAKAIAAITSRVTAYETAANRAGLSPARRPSRQRCNDLMPRAKARCVLPRGHKGPHRSKT